MKKYLHLGLLVLQLLGASCARRQPTPDLFELGTGNCSNAKIGQFNVILQRSNTQPGFYDLKIVTITTANAAGEYVRAALVNSNLEVQELVSGKLVRPNTVVFSGVISPDDVKTFDTVVVLPYDSAQTPIADSLSQNQEAICKLPSGQY